MNNKLIRLLTLLILLLGACRPAPSTTAPTPSTPSPPATDTPIPDPPPASAACAAFLDAWDARDYASMYDRLSPDSRSEIEQDAFSERYEGALRAASVLTVTTRMLSSYQEATEAQVAFEIRLDTALVGELITDTVMSLSLQEGQWWVDWEPGLIWPQLAEDRYFWMEYNIPARANIYDRDGRGLAAEGRIVTVGVIPGQIEDEGALLSALSQVTGLSAEEIRERYEGKPTDWRIPIADVPAEISVEHNDLLSAVPGIYREEKKGRVYPHHGVASHVVGWVAPMPAEQLDIYRRKGYRGDEWVGVSGLEAWGEDVLAGHHGGQLNVVTASGQWVATVAEREAQPSRAIYTTLDRDLQQQVQSILGDRKGAIVVLDANTGAVLAMASGPPFDSNAFTGPTRAIERTQLLSDPRNPLFNRATQGTYPSASVFKIVTMSAAVEEGGMNPSQSFFFCPGYWEGLGPSARKGCWKEDGHGDINLEDGLTASCDVVFYSVGQHLDGVGQDILPRFARGFGFGSPTGIEGVIEQGGLVPGPDWKSEILGEGWWVGDTVNLSIGQGYLLVTPLQSARMIAAVGNGGTLYRPYVVERIAGAGDDVPEQVFEPEAVGELPVSGEHLRAIQEALLGVTTEPIGTAPHRFEGLEIPVAGKTGTAEVGGEDSMPHSWFAAYAPADRPEIAIAVIVENAGEGSTVAAPMTRQVVEAYYDLPLTPLPEAAQLPEDDATPTPSP